jgi:transposase
MISPQKKKERIAVAQAMRSMYDQGYSILDIAKSFNKSKQYVYLCIAGKMKFLKEVNITNISRGRTGTVEK